MASVSLMNASDPSCPVGHLTLIQGSPSHKVLVVGQITGLSEGLHGFHVHQIGDIGDGCKAAGGHFNPFEATHGAPEDETRHVGDLGNIIANADGVADISRYDEFASLYDDSGAGIVGRAFVVHAGEDDLGRGGDDGSLKTGNAGGRVACGVIRTDESIRKEAAATLNNKGEVKLVQEGGPFAPVDVIGRLQPGLSKGVRELGVVGSDKGWNCMRVNHPHGDSDPRQPGTTSRLLSDTIYCATTCSKFLGQDHYP